MSRRHKEKDIGNNYKQQQAESRADGSPKKPRWFGSLELLEKVITVTRKTRNDSYVLCTEKVCNAIHKALTKAYLDDRIEVDDKWLKIPRSYLEEDPIELEVEGELIKEANHSRGRPFLKRLINTVADSKIVGYVKDSYKAVKEKCEEFYQNATQFASCFLKAVFKTFAPEDDPYGKLSHFHSLIEHELPGLKSRKTLSNYYKWYVDWKPAVTYESPKAKTERFKHKLWENLIAWLCKYLQKIAPQYAYAQT